MKRLVLCGMTLIAVAPVFAQTGAPATPNQLNKTVTMTGCVGASADASGFTLGNAMVIPGTVQPGQLDQTPSTLPPTVPPAAAAAAPSPTPPAVTPPATAAAPAAVPPPASPAQVPPRTAAGAVPPVASPAQVPPTATTGTTAAGTSGTTPTSVTGTSGVVVGGAKGNMTSAVGGYRLSGTDMTSWAGQRVQVVGTFAPAMATAAGTTTTGGSGAPAAPPLEFRVQSVQPMSGPCPR